jgi:hypothetical protein
MKFPPSRNFITEHLRAKDIQIFHLVVARMSIEERLTYLEELLNR